MPKVIAVLGKGSTEGAPIYLDASHARTLASHPTGICFTPASFLNGQYTVFGQVVEGMQFVALIKKAPESDRSGTVKNPDKIVALKVAADVK